MNTRAAAVLRVALDVCETNEPINRREGNVAQADLEKRNAIMLRQALAVLERAEKGQA